jgi:hypothetical protein
MGEVQEWHGVEEVCMSCPRPVAACVMAASPLRPLPPVPDAARLHRLPLPSEHGAETLLRLPMPPPKPVDVAVVVAPLPAPTPPPPATATAAKGLAYIAPHIIGCHTTTHETTFKRICLRVVDGRETCEIYALAPTAARRLAAPPMRTAPAPAHVNPRPWLRPSAGAGAFRHFPVDVATFAGPGRNFIAEAEAVANAI